MTEIIKYIILGLVQGFTEPLPISSSGHLVIAENILGLHMPDLNFEIIVNAGSLFAILFFYRQKILTLITEGFRFVFKRDSSAKESFDYIILLIIATIPAGIAGLLLKDIIETYKILPVVGLALILTSAALFFINDAGENNTRDEVTFKDSLVMGFSQVFALIPGISRSGSTTVGGLSNGLNIEKTLEFSFLMYIPISIATIILGVSDIIDSPSIPLVGYGLGFIASLITTYIAISLLLNVVKKGKLYYFAIYCAIVGSGVFLWTLLS